MLASSSTLMALAMNAAFSAFACTDILGTVFEDVNRNGIHDQGERGLPGVRIVANNGVQILTDRLGRFSLPCAVTPGRFGSSFVLKLDIRSLPAGYAVTTANPFWLRAAQGHVKRVRFGVAPAVHPRRIIGGLIVH